MQLKAAKQQKHSWHIELQLELLRRILTTLYVALGNALAFIETMFIEDLLNK